MNRSISIIAILIAASALVAALRPAPGRGPKMEGVASTGSASDLASRFEELQRRHADLERAHQELKEEVAVIQQAAASSDRPAVPPAFEARLNELQVRQTTLEQATRQIDKFGVLTAMETELVSAYQTLFDDQQPLKTRLGQIETLKRFGHFDERAARAVMELSTSVESLDEKSGVLRALTGAVKTPEFRDQILVGLNADLQAGGKSVRYRYHAVEALESMMPDPLVQQWLTHLAQNDPEYKVAARAGQTVGITPPRPAKAPASK
jgi:hypothetical protein